MCWVKPTSYLSYILYEKIGMLFAIMQMNLKVFFRDIQGDALALQAPPKPATLV